MKAVFKKAGPAKRHLNNLRMYGEIVGRKLGITIRPSNIATGATDGKVVHINYAAFSDDPDALVLLEGTCKHEFGHVRYTDFDAKFPILKRPLALSFYRSLEDCRMEARQKRDYPGMSVSIEAALEIMARKGLFALPEADESIEHLFPNMLLNWGRSQLLGQQVLEPGYVKRMSMLCAMVGMPVVKRFLDIAKSGLERARSTEDSVKCAVELEEFLKRELQSMEEQKAQPDPDEQGAGNDSTNPQGEGEKSKSQYPGTGDPSNDGGDQDENAGDKADASNGQPEADAGEEPQDSEASSDAANGSPDRDSGAGDPSNDGGGDQAENAGDQTGTGNCQSKAGAEQEPQGSDTSAEDESDVDPENGLDAAIQAMAQLLGADDLPETDLGNLLQAALNQTAPPGSGDDDILDKRSVENSDAMSQYEGLTRQIELRVGSNLEVLLESRIEDRSRIERQGRKLSVRHLSRVATSPAPKVFRVDDEISGVSTAVSILLDVSASMDEKLPDNISRLHAAVASARAAVSAMDKHEVPCSLHFFGACLTPVKHFGESWRRVRNHHWSITEYNTLTGQAIERVVPELAIREEERKLLLVITDGIPAEPERTCAALQSCEAFGVETALLLINSDHPGEKHALASFKEELDLTGISWIEVNATDQLADGLIQAIKNAV